MIRRPLTVAGLAVASVVLATGTASAHTDGSDSRSPVSAAAPHRPVLLVPALTTHCMEFFVNLPDQSMGFILADRGYDVWCVNLRNSRYGRVHVGVDLPAVHS